MLEQLKAGFDSEVLGKTVTAIIIVMLVLSVIISGVAVVEDHSPKLYTMSSDPVNFTITEHRDWSPDEVIVVCSRSDEACTPERVVALVDSMNSLLIKYRNKM